MGSSGFEERDFSGFGVMARILFVLGRVEARVVSDEDNETGINAGIGSSEERVSGDVKADMFLSASGAMTGKGRTEAASRADFSLGAHSE